VIFNLASDYANATVHKLLNIPWDALTEGEHAADVKPADDDVQSGLSQPQTQVVRPHKLVCLHADKTNNRLNTFLLPLPGYLPDVYLMYRLVEQKGFDLYSVSEYISSLHVLGKGGKTRQRIAWKNTEDMADNIAVFVVLGRFDEDHVQPFHGRLALHRSHLRFNHIRPLSHDIHGVVFSISSPGSQAISTLPRSRVIDTFLRTIRAETNRRGERIKRSPSPKSSLDIHDRSGTSNGADHP